MAISDGFGRGLADAERALGVPRKAPVGFWRRMTLSAVGV